MTPAPGLRILPVGESAVLLELPEGTSPLAAYRRLRAATGRSDTAATGVAHEDVAYRDTARQDVAPRDVAHHDVAHHDVAASIVDLVPAARTVLVTFDGTSTTTARVSAWMRRQLATAPRDGPASGGAKPCPDLPDAVVVELPVRYDGPDLGDVAAHLGCTPGEVVTRHTGTTWTADFIGFAPGFAYLTPAEGRLDVPRRATPRPVVPAGSVALAAGYCGVYPGESPGGWQLIGVTDAELWNPARANPALLVPGTTVRFTRVR